MASGTPRQKRRCRPPGVFTDLVADEAEGVQVALVAGATRGAGRAIAVELARAGFFVYATGTTCRAACGCCRWACIPI